MEEICIICCTTINNHNFSCQNKHSYELCIDCLYKWIDINPTCPICRCTITNIPDLNERWGGLLNIIGLHDSISNISYVSMPGYTEPIGLQGRPTDYTYTQGRYYTDPFRFNADFDGYELNFF